MRGKGLKPVMRVEEFGLVLRRHQGRLDRASFRLFFAENSLNRRSADLYRGSNDMPSDRACTNLRLRAQLPKFMNRPADGIVKTIPHGTGEQAAQRSSGSKLFQPVADRVWMQDESPGRLGRGPLPKPHDLQYLQSMCRCIMRSLFGREPLTLLAVDGQFPLEQCGVPGQGITSCGQAHNRRRVRDQTRPREHVTLGDGNGYRINQLQHRRVGPRRHDLSRPRGFDDHDNRSLESAA